MRSASRSEVGYAQASRQKNVPIAAGNTVWEDQLPKQCDERKHSNSNSTRRLAASTPELRNMEIHEPSIHEQDHSVSAKKIGNVSQRRNVLNASVQNKCIDMRDVHVFVDEIRHPSWGRILSRIRKSTRTQNSRKLNIVSTLLNSW